MADTLETLLNDIQMGYTTNLIPMLDNLSPEKIIEQLGPGGYDELFNAALDSGNADMVKLLLRRSNLIQGPMEAFVDSLKDGEIKTELSNFIRSVNRTNLQSYKGKWKEWQAELKKAKQKGYNDLADRLERRMEFENNRRLENEGKRPAGISENRWFMDEKAWIMDGFGRMEFDMYGQDNAEAIMDELRTNGIRIDDYTAHIKDAKTDALNDYRIYVNAEDVDKLKNFLQQKRDDVMNQETLETLREPLSDDEFENDEPLTQANAVPVDILNKLRGEVENKVVTPSKSDKKKMPLWMPTGMMPRFTEEQVEDNVATPEQEAQKPEVQNGQALDNDYSFINPDMEVQDFDGSGSAPQNKVEAKVKKAKKPENRKMPLWMPTGMMPRFTEEQLEDNVDPGKQGTQRPIIKKRKRVIEEEAQTIVQGSKANDKTSIENKNPKQQVQQGEEEMADEKKMDSVISIPGERDVRDNDWKKIVQELNIQPKDSEEQSEWLLDAEALAESKESFVERANAWPSDKHDNRNIYVVSPHDGEKSEDFYGPMAYSGIRSPFHHGIKFPELTNNEDRADFAKYTRTIHKFFTNVDELRYTDKKAQTKAFINATMLLATVYARAGDKLTEKLDYTQSDDTPMDEICGLIGKKVDGTDMTDAEQIKFLSNLADRYVAQINSRSVEKTKSTEKTVVKSEEKDVTSKRKTTTKDDMTFADPDSEGIEASASPDVSQPTQTTVQDVPPKKKTTFRDLNKLDAHMSPGEVLARLEDVELPKNDNGQKVLLDEIKKQYQQKQANADYVVRGLNGRINNGDMLAFAQHIDSIIDDGEPDNIDFAQARSVKIRSLENLDAHLQLGEVLARLEDVRAKTQNSDESALLDLVREEYEKKRINPKYKIGALNDLVEDTAGVNLAERIDLTIDDGEIENVDRMIMEPVSVEKDNVRIPSQPQVKRKLGMNKFQRIDIDPDTLPKAPKSTSRVDDVPPTADTSDLPPIVDEQEDVVVRRRGGRPQIDENDEADETVIRRRGSRPQIDENDEADETVIRRRGSRPQIDENDEAVVRSRGERPELFEEGEATDLDGRPASWRMPEGALSRGPGFEGNWEQGPSMNFKMTHIAKDSFKPYLRPYYFNPKNLTPEQKEQALEMLTSRGIRPQITYAKNNMNESLNPIRTGDEIWAIGDEYDANGKEVPYAERKHQIESLKSFLSAARKHKDMAMGTDIYHQHTQRGVDENGRPENKDDIPLLPGLKGNWQQGPSKAFRMTHVAKDSFKPTLRPFYFNPNTLSPEDRELARKMLESRGIYPQPGMAPKDLSKGPNPIKAGEPVWVIGGEFDGNGREVPYAERKQQLKKLNTFWKMAARNPAIAFGKDLDVTKANGGKRDMDLPDIVERDDKTNLPPIVERSTGNREPQKRGGENGTTSGDLKDAIKTQAKDVLGAFSDALDRFNARVFEKNISSPEEFGSEFMFGLLAFPFNFLDAYLKTKADRVDLSKAQKGNKKDSSLSNEDDKARQAKAMQEFMKKLAEKNPDLIDELAQKGIIGQNPNISQDERADNVKRALEQDPTLKGRMKDAFARIALENPELLKGMYPSNYNGPMTPDVFLNHLLGWQQDGNVHAQQNQSVVQPQTMAQPQSEMAQMMAMMQQMKAQLDIMKAEIAQLRADNAQLRQELAARDEEMKQLRQENAQLRAQNEALLAQQQAKGNSQQPQAPISQDVPQASQKPTAVQEPVKPVPENTETNQPPVPPTTKVEDHKTEERDVPDLEAVAKSVFMNNLNRSMTHEILKDELKGYADAQLKKPEELQPDSREAFLNTVGNAYASGKVDGLNDLIKSDKELAWANEIAHTVEVGGENGNGDNFPRIKKNIEITGYEGEKSTVAQKQSIQKDNDAKPDVVPKKTDEQKPTEEFVKDPSVQSPDSLKVENQQLKERLAQVEKQYLEISGNQKELSGTQKELFGLLKEIAEATKTGKLVEPTDAQIEAVQKTVGSDSAEQAESLKNNVKEHNKKNKDLTDEQAAFVQRHPGLQGISLNQEEKFVFLDNGEEVSKDELKRIVGADKANQELAPKAKVQAEKSTYAKAGNLKKLFKKLSTLEPEVAAKYGVTPRVQTEQKETSSKIDINASEAFKQHLSNRFGKTQ